jgi:hypothetical protein
MKFFFHPSPNPMKVALLLEELQWWLEKLQQPFIAKRLVDGTDRFA